MTVTIASLNTGLEAALDRTAWLRQRVNPNLFDPLSSAYGAVGNLVADDTTPLQEAIDDAAGAGGGAVVLSLQHRTTAVLTVPPNVDIVSVPGAGAIRIDHATARTLSFTGNAAASPQMIYGVTLGALQDNNGEVLYNAAGNAARVVVERCSIGASAHTQGLMAYVRGASHFWFNHNEMIPRGTQWIVVDGQAFLSIAENVIDWTAGTGGNILAMGAAAAYAVIRGNFFNADECLTDLGILGGSAGVIETAGNIVRGSGSCNVYLYAIPGTATTVIDRGNFLNAAAKYYNSGAGLLPEGSSLDLPRKHFRASGVGTTYTWPDDVETLELEGSSTEPTITMPQQLVKGSRRRLLIKNASGSGTPWGTILFTPAVALMTGTPAVTLANGQYAMFDFEVASVAVGGTANWTVMHQGP